MPPIHFSHTCCFSGYRPEKLPWGSNEDDERCKTLKCKLADVVLRVYLRGIRHYICGMARGADMYFFDAVAQLREKYPDVTLEAAIPCEEQASKWFEAERARYFDAVARCDYETILSRQCTQDCMARRNMYMVDNSSILIAVYDGRFGGTMHTIGYAAKKGLEIIEIRP